MPAYMSSRPPDPRLVLFKSAEAIDERVTEIGAALAASHGNLRPVILGLLNGAFVFMADLIRAMGITCEVAFWRLSSYGSGLTSQGDIQETMGTDQPLAGRHVIVVEDIVDSGATLARVRDRLDEMNPASVTVVALLQAATSSAAVDHVGFVSGPDFVVGYGLDAAHEMRNLPDLYYLKSPEQQSRRIREGAT